MEKAEFASHETVPVWGNRLLLRRSHNPGMAFRLGEERGNGVKMLSATLTVACAVGFGASLKREDAQLVRLGLALLLAGGLSNTCDRILRGYVVDYLSVNTRHKPVRELVFNLADLSIATGALLTALGAAQ